MCSDHQVPHIIEEVQERRYKMTIQVIAGTPHAYWNGVGFVPVRGASLRDAQALDHIVAFALVTGHNTTTAPGSPPSKG